MNNNITIDIINQYQQLIEKINNNNHNNSNFLLTFLITIYPIIFLVTKFYIISHIDYHPLYQKIITLPETVTFILITLLCIMFFLKNDYIYDNFSLEDRDKIINIIEKYPELTNNEIIIKNNNKVIKIDQSKTNKILYWSIVYRNCELWEDIKSNEINNFIKNHKLKYQLLLRKKIK